MSLAVTSVSVGFDVIFVVVLDAGHFFVVLLIASVTICFCAAIHLYYDDV